LGGSRDVYALIEEGRRLPDLLADQGTADPFLEVQQKTHLPVHACEAAKQIATIGMQNGYDYSYCFTSTFVDQHLRWHHERPRWRGMSNIG
jgi:S-formylglutathione hydrolase